MNEIETAREAWRRLRDSVLHECFGAAEDVAALDKFFGTSEESE